VNEISNQSDAPSVVLVPSKGKWQGGSSPDVFRPATSSDDPYANYSEDPDRYGIDQEQYNSGLVLLVRRLRDPKLRESERSTHIVVLPERSSANAEQLHALCGECFLPKFIERLNPAEKAGAPCFRCIAVAQYQRTKAVMIPALYSLAPLLKPLANQIESDDVMPEKLEEFADILVEAGNMFRQLASEQRLTKPRQNSGEFATGHVDWG
jgi:hypothetical protein